MTDFTLPDRAVATSLVTRENVPYWLEREGAAAHLVIGSTDPAVVGGFTGQADGDRFRAALTPGNAAALRQALPWLTPTTFGLSLSAGFGDRLGICTPGHVAAVNAVGGTIKPVFAQQSIREMGRTNRTPLMVLDDATWGAFEGGWQGPVGADADHLKTLGDIDSCVEAGYVFFTLDPGDHVDPEAESATEAVIRQKAAALDWAALDSSLEAFIATYAGHTIELDGEPPVVLDEEAVVRAMAKYGPALVQAMTMYRHLDGKGIAYEFEMAVDETDYPTKPAEHVVIISELARLGARPVSFAPRFVGGFEKGVEYIGDLDALARDFQIHAAIARTLGPYKLSLHSGSDKYSTYPLIAEATQGVVHLKTAGTSWAEALRVIARHDPALFRDLLRLALDQFEINRHSYHLSCDPAKIPANPADDELDGLVTAIDSRQVLHVAYGPALTTLGPRLFACWSEYRDELTTIIRDHFVRHLEPFAAWAR
ncbi:MAG: tagaturonate epimerase family protein [Propionibacteriaceae bacterium]|jgi:hypothetical protein|nr:tagaturonate epimerase family protein [Propionibacteriaceae bacterium]